MCAARKPSDLKSTMRITVRSAINGLNQNAVIRAVIVHHGQSIHWKNE